MVDGLRRWLRAVTFACAALGAGFCTVEYWAGHPMEPRVAWMVGIAAFVALMGVLLVEDAREQ